MRWIATAGCRLAAAAALVWLAAGRWAAAQPAADARWVEGEVLVRYRSEIQRRELPALFPDAAVQRRLLPVLERIGGRPVERVRVEGRRTTELLAAYGRRPEVESVTPNYIRRIQRRQSLPDDPFFPQQWALLNTGQTVNGSAGTVGADISASWAWPLSRPPTQQVVIAVIDTGVDYRHPDLAGVMWVNPGENPDSDLDDDGNGYTNDVYGFDFSGAEIDLGGGDVFRLPRGGDPMDNDGHGTHVAGIAAAAAGNAIGIAGLVDARIMALKASPDGEEITLAESIEAIAYATMMKTDYGVPIAVINASYGATGGSNVLERETIISAGDAGIVFCAAAGNNGANNDLSAFYPASYRLPNLVAVAASDRWDNRAGFSNYGLTSVHLAAPGVDILSTEPLWVNPWVTLERSDGGDIPAGIMAFAGFTHALTATVIDCELGYAHQFPAAVTGQIALIERGELYFTEKIRNAMAAGAAAALVYNNTNGPFDGTLMAPSDWIPAATLTREDGLAILASADPVVLTLSHLPQPESAYAFMQGTSMATPFVAGALAFMDRQFPADTPPQRIARLVETVDPLPSFSNRVSSGGRLNLQRAVDTDADGLPDWWELDWVGDLETMDETTDTDGNGLIDLHEFWAGTDPTDAASGLYLNGLVPAADGGGLTLAWDSVAGRLYEVMRAAHVLGPFQTVSPPLPADPPRNTWIDPQVADPATFIFYQIRLAE